MKKVTKKTPSKGATKSVAKKVTTKTAKKPARRKPEAKKPVAGDLPKVRVRMYRQGLGDCFLITFHVGGDEKHMLVDCGSLGAVTTGVKIAQVVADIQKTTKKRIDLLVATHEHADHVNGFGRQQDAFREFAPVGRVWLAWTENPDDELAKSIAKNKSDLGAALASAAAALDAPGMSDASRERGREVRSLLGFFGADDEGAFGASSSFAESIDAAMKFVGHGLGVEPRYLMPGEGPLEEAWLPGFRFYVLGPPHDAAALRDLGEDDSSQLYHVLGGLRAGAGYQLSGQDMSTYARALGPGQEAASFAREWPFDPRLCYDREDARVRQWFANSYFAESDRWRTVDEDWLGVASDLALQLDSMTNNTSLVLAIERVADGKVLLFPADAQEGNWLSWHSPKELTWNVGTRAVTTTDLLARTVFYKVGHHASHNATAKGQGLELMKQEGELTAFIPVDRAVALTRNPQGAWKMPARPLYRRLLEKCQGRVVRSDLGWADDAANAKSKETEKEFASMASAAEWKAWKQSQADATHVTVNDLFVDYLLD